MIKIQKGNKNVGIEEHIKKECANEYKLLARIIDMNDIYQKRLDTENKCCRYPEIRTYKDNKVEIKSDNGYINASWIHIPTHRSFIATQGPLESTIEDFWEMCYSYDIKVIVMLCKLDENYKEKCANYWNVNIKNYKIEQSKETNKLKEGLKLRNFSLTNKKNGISKNILQIHFTCWEDHSIPDSSYDKIIDIIDLIDQNKGMSPVVVHCSAGIGRTGTFIGLYNLYHEILAQINNDKIREIKFSIMNLVRKLKEMRLYLVENENQYSFLFEFANRLLKEKNLD